MCLAILAGRLSIGTNQECCVVELVVCQLRKTDAEVQIKLLGKFSKTADSRAILVFRQGAHAFARQTGLMADIAIDARFGCDHDFGPQRGRAANVGLDPGQRLGLVATDVWQDQGGDSDPGMSLGGMRWSRDRRRGVAPGIERPWLWETACERQHRQEQQDRRQQPDAKRPIACSHDKHLSR